jgi:hypothetical protein
MTTYHKRTRGGLSLAPHLAVLLLAGGILGCDDYDHTIWYAEEWNVATRVEEEHLLVAATIVDVHGDFIHMSIRREGHVNDYTVERSPAPEQPERDWSRVHHWFGELHPDTYLEGRIDDGSGEGPPSFETYTFRLPRSTNPRDNFAEEGGSDYVYITKGYDYADGNPGHPGFGAGTYEIEIYAWYTGRVNDHHPSIDGRPGVQYVHYEHPITSTTFVIE